MRKKFRRARTPVENKLPEKRVIYIGRYASGEVRQEGGKKKTNRKRLWGSFRS